MESELEDKTITCTDCKQDFLWTAGEQSFMQGLCDDGKLDYTDKQGGYHKGQVTAPKRCEACRAKRKAQRTTQN